MPAGVDTTWPEPVPASATTRPLLGANCAVTVASPVTLHGAVPEQVPPVQPRNVEPAVAAAVSVTVVPGLKAATHIAPQLIPAGVEVIVPSPPPVFSTVTVKLGASVGASIGASMDASTSTVLSAAGASMGGVLLTSPQATRAAAASMAQPRRKDMDVDMVPPMKAPNVTRRIGCLGQDRGRVTARSRSSTAGSRAMPRGCRESPVRR